MRRGLAELFGFATIAPARNRDSARRLAALDGEVVRFGHGEPSRDGARFAGLVASPRRG